MSDLIDTAESLVLSISKRARGSRTVPELMTHVSSAMANKQANRSLIEFERNRGREESISCSGKIRGRWTTSFPALQFCVELPGFL